MRAIFLLLFSLFYLVSFGQSSQNWHWKDYETDSVHGISLKKAYQTLASLSQKPSPIIVAVIDGGVDTNHVALKNLLWTNPKEIPNNKIDDDKNGYIDDIHGWNFIGGKDGRNINKAAAEMTRIYHRYKNIYEGKQIDTTQLSANEKNTYLIWQKTADEIKVSENDLSSLQYIKMASNALKKMGAILLKELPDSNFTVPILESYQPIGRVTLDTKMAYLRTVKILGIEKESTFPEIIQDLEEYVDGKEKAATAKEQAPEAIREDIVKDAYFNFSDKSNRMNEAVTSTQAYLKPVPEQTESSMGLRYTYWKNSLKLIAEKPLVGHGTGSFSKEYRRIVKEDWMASKNPHNEFFMIGVQLGLLGLIIYLGFLASQYYYAKKLQNENKWLAQGLLLSLIITSIFNSPLMDHNEGHWFATMIALCFASLQGEDKAAYMEK